MTMPTDLKSYTARFHANQRMTGFGIDVTVHVPCPFCSAPDWIVMKVIDTKEAMKTGASCEECGRSARAIFHVDQPGNAEFEVVQTGGSDAPDWLPPIRRVETP